MDASRRKVIPLVSTAWMHESIRPVDGAVRAPGLDGVRCFWPHKIIGRAGLVVHQAWKLRPCRRAISIHLAFCHDPGCRAEACCTSGSCILLLAAQPDPGDTCRFIGEGY